MSGPIQHALARSISQSFNRTPYGYPLHAPLLVNLGTFSLTRNTVARGWDHEGILRDAVSGEAFFGGARRVENLLSQSGDLTHGDWFKGSGITITSGVSDPDGGNSAFTVSSSGSTQVVRQTPTLPAGQYRMSIWVRRRSGTGNVSVYRGAGFSAHDITSLLTSEWQRFGVAIANNTGVQTGLGFYLNEGEIDVWHPQAEEVSGASNQAPSEYVASETDYGAGVNGVRYFSYENGNTVTDNVVTEATGSTIAGLKGVQQSVQQSSSLSAGEHRDFSVWTETSASSTFTQDQNGIDGVPNTAWTMIDGERHIDITVADDSVTRVIQIAFAKSQDDSAVRLRYLGGTTTLDYQATLDNSAGTVSAGGDATASDVSVEDHGNFWLVEVKGANNGTGNTTMRLHFGPLGASGTCVPDWVTVVQDTFVDRPLKGGETLNAEELTAPWPSGLVNNFVVALGYEARVDSANFSSSLRFFKAVGDGDNYVEGVHNSSSWIFTARAGGTNATSSKAESFNVGDGKTLHMAVRAPVELFVDGATSADEETNPGDLQVEPSTLYLGINNTGVNPLPGFYSNVRIKRVPPNISDSAVLAI